MDGPILVYVVAVWVAALVIPGLRTLRFLSYLAALSVVLLLADTLAPGPRVGLRIVSVVSIGAGILLADQLGLGSMNPTERRLDREIHQAQRMASSPDRRSQSDALTMLGALIETQSIDDRWRAGLRMLRRAWATSIEPSNSKFMSPTPSRSFALAGTRYLHDVRTRRTIGARSRSGTLEESILLRAYLDDVRLAMPPGRIGPSATRHGPWSDRATAIIEELRRLPLRDPLVMALRDQIASLLEMEVTMRVSAPTAADQGTYDQIAALVNEAWRDVDDRAEPGLAAPQR